MEERDQVTSTPKISVIVPIYNAAPYVAKCIEGILSQTYRNIEVILIDDGSTDRSAEICQAFAQKDPRIRFISQENQGVSATRNNGIALAEGEFIAFIDSDDEVCPEYLSFFSLESDLSIQGYISKEGQTEREISFKERSVQGSVAKVFCINSFNSAVWSKLFRKSIIKENNIQFPINLCFSEDTIFLLHYVRFAHTLFVSSKAGYLYINREASLSSKKYPIENMMEKEKLIMNHYTRLFPDLKFRKRFLREITLNILAKYYFYYDFDLQRYRETEYLKSMGDANLNRYDKMLLSFGMRFFANYVRWRRRFKIRVLKPILGKDEDTLLNV